VSDVDQVVFQHRGRLFRARVLEWADAEHVQIHVEGWDRIVRVHASAVLRPLLWVPRREHPSGTKK